MELRNLFCDFRLAKILDELGFNDKCLGSYLGFGNGEMREDNPKIYKTTEPELFISGQFPSSEDKSEELQLGCFGFCHAPMYVQVKEWLWIHKSICVHTFSDFRDDGTMFCCDIVHGHAPIIKQIQTLDSPITAEIEGIKKAVEYLYEEHHKTKVL